MLIAHISDFHIVPAPRLCYGFIDTRESLAKIIKYLNSLSSCPDLVVMSGDLVDEPSSEAYATLAALLAELTIPFLMVAGNHDDRELMACYFPDHTYLKAKANSSKKNSFIFDDVKIITIDSVVPRKEYGVVLDETIDWLKEELSYDKNLPVMIVMHHPPFHTGLPFMDGFQPVFENFTAVIETEPQIKLIACGHVHRAIDGALGSIRISSAPSTGHQFTFTQNPLSPPKLSQEPLMVRFHSWHQGSVSSFIVPIESERVMDFPNMSEDRWLQIQRAMLEGLDRNSALRLVGKS